MREIRSSGSVEGVMSNHDPYSDFTQFEDYVFSVRGPGQSMHGVGRLPWSYGPPDDPQRLTGTDVGVTKDGKLTALYAFIDSPSQK
jgi:hypothetical protein